MKLNLHALMERVNERAVPSNELEECELAMTVLEIVCYSPITHFGEIDFDSFTFESAKRAFDELLEYYPDDFGDDENENKGNLLLELNRIAHLRNLVGTLKSSHKRRFF